MVTQLKKETITLPDLITRFLGRPGLSPRTRDYYQNILANLNWYAGKNDWPQAVEEITRGQIRDFLDYVATQKHRWPEGRRPSYQKAAPATVYHYGKAVKTLLNWAEDEEYIEVSPIARLKIAAPHYRDVEPYSNEEVLAFLAVCDDDLSNGCRYLGIRNKAIISLFVATGLRLAELSGITLADFDPRLQQVRVLGKGERARVVPVNGEARKALKRYLGVRQNGSSEELWQTDDGQPMSLYSIKIMVARLKKRARLNGGGGPHRFRHYFATQYLEAGGDINSLRLLLGHATLSMVLRYSRYVDVQRALTEHHLFNPLDRLMRQGNVKRGWHY